MICLQKQCCKSPSLLFPVNLEMSLSVGCCESYGVPWRRRPGVDRHLFGAHGLMTELLQMGKWTDWNANFHTMINLQYEIVGTELSCPEAVRYCFILLVSYYQQSQSTPTAPRTQSPFYITFIRRCTNVENIWRQPSELCFLRGWGASAEGGDLQLAHSASVHWAGRQWHHEGHLHSSQSSSHTSSYRFQFLTHVYVHLKDLLKPTLFRTQVFTMKCEHCQMYVSPNACVM